MQTDQQAILKAAIQANAVWCDAVCVAHGLKTRWGSDFWVCEDRPPVYYPDLITLSPEADPMIAGKAATSIKDSYDRLSLRKPYFKLFSAHWYMAHPTGLIGNDGKRLEVRKVRTVPELEAWSKSWGGQPEGDDIFPQRLLTDPRIRFLAVGGSGLAACLAETQYGQIWSISNLYGPREDLTHCFRHMAEEMPGIPITGYGDEEETEMLQELGFLRLTPLSVWLAS